MSFLPESRAGATPRRYAGGRSADRRQGGRLALLGLLSLLVPLVPACGDRSGDPSAGAGRSGGMGSDPSRSGESVELTVFAAASLTSAFRELSEAYEDGEGRTRVLLNLAGSQTLAAQILEGAPADVFASANPAQMARVADADLLAAPPVTFAENTLAIAVEPGNPRGISGIEDLARPGLAVVLGAPGVPVGAYARRALEEAGVDVRPASLEPDVKQVVAKVSLGEADAGIVYETDLRAAGDAVEGIRLTGATSRPTEYRLAVLAAGPHPDMAEGFVDFVRSSVGRDILRRHGFRVPSVATASGSVRDGKTTVGGS